VDCIAEPAEMHLEKVTKVVQFANLFFNAIKAKPISHKIEKIENAHIAGQIDEWHDLAYEGFKLSFYRVVPEKQNILTRLSIVSANYKLPFGLQVGTPKSTIIEVLGKPTEVTSSSISYEIENPYTETVTFHFGGANVNVISWEFEID
jgi:hypothetical protein